jgi:hypothetical protein
MLVLHVETWWIELDVFEGGGRRARWRFIKKCSLSCHYFQTHPIQSIRSRHGTLASPNASWTFHPASEKTSLSKFTKGIKQSIHLDSVAHELGDCGIKSFDPQDFHPLLVSSQSPSTITHRLSERTLIITRLVQRGFSSVPVIEHLDFVYNTSIHMKFGKWETSCEKSGIERLSETGSNPSFGNVMCWIGFEERPCISSFLGWTIQVFDCIVIQRSDSRPIN